ncbi:O-antigen ligase family protein [Vibrio atypicus]|uniref:O-antigen ligase family protein n=1 Tax=Vibrio atypicus TaxID=558271 RepID=UPI001358977D|nr:O-antigen ligase family protein [Vibrio atypicus]
MISLQLNRVLYFLGFVLLTFYVVFFSVTENYETLFFPIIFVLVFFLFFNPKLFGYLFILSTVNFLGLINPEHFVRIPGVFKFDDLLFISMVGIYIVSNLREGWRFPTDNVFVLLTLIIMSFVFMTICQFFLTSIRFDLPVISSLKVGRGFLFILSFFYFVKFFSTTHEKHQLLKFIFAIAIIQVVMMLLQILGFEIAEHSIVRQLETVDDSVTRVYLPAYFIASISFFTSTSFLISTHSSHNRLIITIISILSLLSILLSYTRTYWVAIIVGLIVLFILSERIARYKLLLCALIVLVLFLPMILFQSDGFIMDRFFSIFFEVKDREGNFIYRFTENPQRIIAFLDYPIFGPGFVHSSYAASLFNFVIDEKGLSESQVERALLLQTNDSGLITLLVSFGLLGVCWALCKIVSVIRICLCLTYNANRSIVVAMVAFIISIWSTCATTYGFTYQDGIVALSLSLYLIWGFCSQN